MKRLELTYIFIFANILLLHANAAKIDTLSTLKVSERAFNFGSINENNGKVSHIFTIHNTGNQPIVIDDIVYGCSCLSVDFSKEPIRPFKSKEIKVTFNPAYYNGMFSKELNIITNNRQFRNRIWVKGEVVPTTHPVTDDYPYQYGNNIHLNRSILGCGTMSNSDTREFNLGYANNSKHDLKIKIQIEKGYKKMVDIKAPASMKAGQRGTINILVKAPTFKGEKVIRIYLCENGKRINVPLSIRVTGKS